MELTPIFDDLVAEFAKRDPAVHYHDLCIGSENFVWGLVQRIPLKDVQPLVRKPASDYWQVFLSDDDGELKAAADPDDAETDDSKAVEADAGDGRDDDGDGSSDGGSADGEKLLDLEGTDTPQQPLEPSESPVRTDEPPVPKVRAIKRPELPLRIPGQGTAMIHNFIGLITESLKTAFTHPTGNAA